MHNLSGRKVCVGFSPLMVEGHLVGQSYSPLDSQEERERRGEEMGVG